MHSVTATPSFIPTLQEIADNTEQTVREFQVITPSQETSYSLKYGNLVIGIAVSIVSLMVFKQSRIAAAGFFSIGLFFFWKSVDSKLVDTDEVVKQRQAINAKFDPCIEGLKAERRKKIKVTYDTLHDKPIKTMEGVKSAIDEVAAVYDGIKERGEYLLATARELDQASYTILRESSKILMDFKIEAFPKQDAISSLALEKMKTLCVAAKLFYAGDNTGTNSRGDDAYVFYGCYDKKAIICF